MRNCKKLLSLAMALAVALALLPGAALAAEDKPERGVITYTEHIAPQYEDASLFSDGLAAVKKDGKWGYIDTEGKTVIPFQYDLAYEFNEGYAIVGKLVNTESWEHEEWDEDKEEYVKDGTTDYWYTYEMGFIDGSNKLTWFTYTDWDNKTVTAQCGRSAQKITNPVEYIFHNGYVVIVSYDVGRLYNTKGEHVELTATRTYTNWEGDPETGTVTAYPYDYPVNEGYVCTDEGYYHLPSGTILEIDFEPQEQETGSGDSTEYVYKFISNRLPFNQGLAPVWVCTNTYGDSYDDYTYELGFINTSGKWVIQPRPTGIYWISGIDTVFRVFGETGLCVLSNAEGTYGAIDRTGQTVIPFQYEELRIVEEGLLPYSENGRFGYLDAATLKTAIAPQYENVTGFNNGLAVVYDGTKAFLIDWKGNPVPGADKVDPSTYIQVDEDGGTTYYSPGEYVVIEEDGKYGYGHVEYLPNLPEKGEMSDWAYEEVTAAIEENFVPIYLQSLYRNNIKRGEFCDTVVQAITEILETDAETLVKEKTGKALSDWEKEYPFSDTTGSDVIAAYALGIVRGRGNGTFGPYDTITRQEAAAFLTRGAKVLGMDTTVSVEASFADGEAVADWAQNDVSYISQIKVMGGTGENMFSPLGNYSREQSFVTVYRLYRAMLEQR